MTTTGYTSSGSADDLPNPPSGPAPGAISDRIERTLRTGEAVRVLRISEGDRLAVLLPYTYDLQETYLLEIRDEVARWAGIAPDRILLLGDGIELAVVTETPEPVHPRPLVDVLAEFAEEDPS